MAFIKFKPIASTFNLFTNVTDDKLERDVFDYISSEERVVYSYKSKRDLCLITSKRIILIDRKGIRGFRKSVYSIKYDSICTYTLNINNFDSAIEIITNSSHKLNINFFKPIPLKDVYEVYGYITSRII